MTIQKLGMTLHLTERAKWKALLVPVALAVFVAVTHGVFFERGLRDGHLQLLWSVLCVLGVLLLELLHLKWEGKRGERLQNGLVGVLFFLLPVATLCMMEFLHGTFIYNWSAKVFLQNYVFMLLLYLLFFALSGRVHISVLLANILSYVFGLTNHFIMAFRSTAFVPADLISAETGFTVMNNFEFFVDNQIVLSTALFVLLLVLAMRLRLAGANKVLVRTTRVVGLLTTMLFCGTLYKTDWFAGHGMKPDFFNQARGYTNHGSLFYFTLNTKYLTVQKPSNYNAEEVNNIVQEMIANTDDSAAISETLPNVICIMNEAFSDLSVVGDFETNEDYMPFYRSLKENTIKGYAHVSIFGAGTANSEFEFLTGNTMAFLPIGSSAYDSFVSDEQPSLVSTMNTLGYESIAFHPYYGNNWSRDEVYEAMHFQDYIDISDLLGEDLISEYKANSDFNEFSAAVQERFQDESVFLRRYVSDAFDYKKIKELYAANQEKGENPFFMFNVTMQNHSGYLMSSSNFSEKIHLTGAMKDYYFDTDQYLSLIKEADDALRGLIEYYSTVEEPTVICFYGDHEPSVDTEFYEELYGKSLDDLTLEEEQRMYITPFLIWANYDIEEQTVSDISLNYLSSLLADVAGLPKTDYQRYLSELYQTLPVITAVGYMDNEGNWYHINDKSSPYADLIEDYRKVQYNNLIDTENRQTSLFELAQ